MEEDFIERISREVDEQFKPAHDLSPEELQELYTQAVDDLKTAKIEYQDLQRKYLFARHSTTSLNVCI
jgi:hypothetical protein